MSDLDPNEVDKMKVVELRDTLKERGLESKGNKAALVKRLKIFLLQESSQISGFEEDLDASQDDLDATDTSQNLDSTANDSIAEPAQEAAAEPEPVAEAPEQAEEEAPELAQEAMEPEPMAEPVTEPEPVVDPEPEPVAEVKEEEPAGKPAATEEPAAEEAKMEQEEAAPAVEGEAPKEEPAEEEKPKDEEMKESADGAEEGTGGPPEGEEMKVVDEAKGDDAESERDRKRRRSRSPARRRSRSPRRRSRSPRRRSLPRFQPPEMEKDDWLQATNVQIDRYNCDLPLVIEEDGCSAKPMVDDGYAFMWHGCRSTYGVTEGKVGFEVKLNENIKVDHLPAEETTRHVLRLGFSTNATSTQLGEEPLSYGYGGTGKASTECKFQDYGGEFAEGDVMGAWVDFEGEVVVIQYTKNGADLGTCFEVEKAKLGENALFPHVLTKNISFECNFGEKEEPFFAPPEGFSFVASVELEKRVRGAVPPEKKEDCEILMMCGLPGCGKTTWAAKHMQEDPDKRYTVMGTNFVIDKMKVMGLPRKKNYAGRWDVLIDKATKCLNKQLELAAKKKRNYILDQTNVYASAQRRKLRPFEGFKRKAVVIVPTDEEFKARVEKREKEEGKEVPDSAVYEMKANFALPEAGPLFDEINWIELKEEEAKTLVKEYNEEGRKHAPPPQKRFHSDRGRDRRDNRGGDRGRDRWSGGRGGGGYDRNRGGYGGRGGGYGSRDFGGRGGGGYRDNRDRSSYRGGRQASYDNRSSGGRSSGGYSSGSARGGYGGQSGGYGGSGGSGGYWGSQQPGSWGGQQQGGWGGQQGQWGGYGQQGYGSGQWGSQQGSYGSGQQGTGSKWNSSNQQSGYGSYGYR